MTAHLRPRGEERLLLGAQDNLLPSDHRIEDLLDRNLNNLMTTHPARGDVPGLNRDLLVAARRIQGSSHAQSA